MALRYVARSRDNGGHLPERVPSPNLPGVTDVMCFGADPMANVPDGFPESELPDAMVVEIADQYRNVVNLIYGQRPFDQYCAPLLANAAFTVELYLKSLNAKLVYHSLAEELDNLDLEDSYRVTVRAGQGGHVLTPLFDAIDPPLQNELQRAYSQTKAAAKIPHLRDFVDRYKNVFVHSRYPFEDKMQISGTDITGLVFLVNFFSDFVHGLKE
jgi:hypothetical protein